MSACQTVTAGDNVEKERQNMVRERVLPALIFNCKYYPSIAEKSSNIACPKSHVK